MSDVGRFGVFLPSYVWEGDGPERARGIKAFARRVEELGFDSLFITDHLLVGEAVLLGQLARAADDAGGRRRGDRAGPARDVDPDHAAAQPGDPGQGAGDAPVPVRQPGHPRRRRRLERRRVRGGRRPQVGARQADRRDARHHDAAARGRDASPTTATYYSVDDVFIEPRTAQRPLLWIGGGSQLADPKSPDVPKFVESVKAPDRPGRRLDPAADLPAAGHRPRLGRAAGRDARGRQGPVETASSPTRTSCTWS